MLNNLHIYFEKLGESEPVQQQGLCWPVRLLEVWHVGHHRGACLP